VCFRSRLVLLDLDCNIVGSARLLVPWRTLCLLILFVLLDLDCNNLATCYVPIVPSIHTCYHAFVAILQNSSVFYIVVCCPYFELFSCRWCKWSWSVLEHHNCLQGLYSMESEI
jgi:hypothetical protein